MQHLGEVSDPKIAARYAGVPAAERERFRAFRQAYSYRSSIQAGFEWPYLVTDPRPETLLLLSGALIHPDVSWQTISHFAERYRVIAPAYPPVMSMTGLADGIAAILRHENVATAHVMGGSYGGLVAQVFARRYPALTRSLVLSHTFAPDQGETGRSLRKTLGWLRWLPPGVLRWLMGRRLARLMPAHAPETALLEAMFAELTQRRLTKADILAGLWRTVDYSAQTFTPADLAGWPGRVLLVLADDDPGTPAPTRAALQALYPGARLHLFHGTGHSASITREKEYQALIDDFLTEATRA